MVIKAEGLVYRIVRPGISLRTGLRDFNTQPLEKI